MISLALCLLLQEAHDRVVDDAVAYCRQAPPGEAAAVAAILYRWFPDRHALRPFLGRDSGLGKESMEFLRMQARLLGEFAKAELKEGRPVSAGLEAFRAVNLDPQCFDAAEILGYVDFLHPREVKLRARGLKKTLRGWREPENGRYEFTCVTIITDLPVAEAAELGVRLDWFLEWVRARFCRVEGYTEPAWPIEMRVPAKDADYEAQKKAVLGEAKGTSSYGVSFYPDRPFVLVNGEKTKRGYEKTIGVAQHEATHAFFALCFNGRPGARYAWATEGFPTLCSYVSPDLPHDGGLRAILRKKFPEGDWRRVELERLAAGEDLFPELNKLDQLAEPRTQLQAMLAGASLSAFAFQDPAYRERYAMFLAAHFSGRAEDGVFEKRMGATDELSRKMGEWLKRE